MGKTSKLKRFKPSEPEKEKKRKIWLCIPSYNGIITVATMKSIMHDMMPLIFRGDEIRVFDEIGHADIYLLRAQIVSWFMADEDATDLVMIDNDVAWDEHGLSKLIDSPADFVAGAYPQRDIPIRFHFMSDLMDGKPLMGDPATGLVEVWGMPGGFMRVKRHVLEKMYDHYGDELTHYDEWSPSKKTVRLFDPYWYERDGKKLTLSEDYAFCRRWRDIGGKIYMDTSIGMAHIGSYAFKGHLGEWLDDNMTKPSEGEAA